MAIFKFDNENFEMIKETQFANEGIKERQHIQNALKKQIEVIDSELLIISEEFGDWSDSKRRIDLLAIDKNANIVVIELKRTETGEHMDLQAIRYASMVSTLRFDRAVDIFNKYLKTVDSELNAEEEILNFLGWEDKEYDFASEVRIILVSSGFGKELTTSVMWLNERGLNIECYKMIPHKFNEQILIDIQQVIPLPEAEDYQIRVREQIKERKEVREASRDKTKYSFNGEFGLGKRGLVQVVWKKYIQNNQGISYDKLLQDFPNIKFSEREKALDQQKRDNNNNVRYFVEDDEVLTIEQKQYGMSNQWGKGNINNFIVNAKVLGFDIEEML